MFNKEAYLATAFLISLIVQMLIMELSCIYLAVKFGEDFQTYNYETEKASKDTAGEVNINTGK